MAREGTRVFVATISVNPMLAVEARAKAVGKRSASRADRSVLTHRRAQAVVAVIFSPMRNVEASVARIVTSVLVVSVMMTKASSECRSLV